MQKITFKLLAALLAGFICFSLAFSALAGTQADEASARPYYIFSNSRLVKAVFSARHQFKGAFSANLTARGLDLARLMGLRAEPVALYQLSAKPGTVCGNGVCEPGENERKCPVDCSAEPEPEPRTCYPAQQLPWGVVKVNGGAGGTDIKVAVLDTGAFKDHLDLKANIVDCRDTTKRGVKSGCADNNGHGTHTAGTVAASAGQDQKGIYGTAPQSQLMIIKVCGPSGCWGDDIAEAIYYAADNGADIISMSLGGDSPDPFVGPAVDYAVSRGVLVVAAAGNDGPALGSIDYPAAYQEVVAVGAIEPQETVADFSSRGVNDGDYVIEEMEVELVGPGVYVESTYKNGCYAYFTGTSMAAPHIAGLAAKLWQGSGPDTRVYLQSIAKDIGPVGDDPASGFGLPIAP